MLKEWTLRWLLHNYFNTEIGRPLQPKPRPHGEGVVQDLCPRLYVHLYTAWDPLILTRCILNAAWTLRPRRPPIFNQCDDSAAHTNAASFLSCCELLVHALLVHAHRKCQETVQLHCRYCKSVTRTCMTKQSLTRDS